jgi:hypothetical protein
MPCTFTDIFIRSVDGPDSRLLSSLSYRTAADLAMESPTVTYQALLGRGTEASHINTSTVESLHARTSRARERLCTHTRIHELGRCYVAHAACAEGTYFATMVIPSPTS